MVRRIYKRDSHGRFAGSGKSRAARRRRNRKVALVGATVLGAIAGSAAGRSYRPPTYATSRVNIFDPRAGK